MRLKIYSTHHTKPLFSACHDIFIPLWGAGPPSNDGSYEIDSKIPRKSTLGYNETALQYYIWKHELSNIDYIGFEHYRRLILFPALYEDYDDLVMPSLSPGAWHGFADEALYGRLLDKRSSSSIERIAKLKMFLSSFDLVLPVASTSETLREQWALCKYDPIHLELLAKCLHGSTAYREAPFPVDFDVRHSYFCNIFVMKTRLFAEYMVLWEQVMFALQEEVDFTSRVPSMLSERLFSTYFYHRILERNLKVAEVPFILCDSRKVPEQVSLAGVG